MIGLSPSSIVGMDSMPVLEHTGIPVTGTPSISFEFYFIINRWTIYPRGDTYIDGDPSINVIK